jgi:hypothetical protein
MSETGSHIDVAWLVNGEDSNFQASNFLIRKSPDPVGATINNLQAFKPSGVLLNFLQTNEMRHVISGSN